MKHRHIPPPQADWRQLEAARLQWRRSMLGHEPAAPRCGLALSGGGIRSATVSLGMLQALARAGMLESFDYLSTVSGGGYAGSFLCSLFTPASVRAAGGESPSTQEMMQAREQALARLRAIEQRAADYGNGNDPGRAARALEWLRDSGRYLAPNGGGDYFYALVLWLRNLLAVHYVVGIALLLPLALLGVLNLEALSWAQAQLPLAEPALAAAPWHAGALYLGLSLAAWLLAVLPLGVAYWYAWMPQRRRRAAGTRWIEGLLTAPSLLGFCAGPLIALVGWGQSWFGWTLLAGVIVWLAWVWFAAAWSRGFFPPNRSRAAALMLVTRTRLTQWLATATQLALGLLLLAAVLLASAWLARWLQQQGHTAPGLTLAGFVAAVLSLGKLFPAAGLQPSAAEKRLLLRALPMLAALLLGTAVVLFWGVWAALLLDFARPAPPWLALAGLVLLALITGVSFQFLNLSTLQNLYTARIVRAYLGATNPARDKDSRSGAITEAQPRDDMSLQQYYGSEAGPPSSLAPLHLINVTINETVQARSALVYQDRKGLPLAITPDGYLVDGRFRQRQADGPGGFELLSLGRWIGISGAAFAPGLGRGTTPERALLTGLANVRLGYWWRAGRARARELGSWLFATQIHLYRELRGKFFGTGKRYWYLTDGGHFENTAVYELLRRRMGFILALDNGADPDYRFADVANLMRLARVDFGAVFEPLVPPAALADLFGNPGGFARGSREGTHFLLGYRVTLPAAAGIPESTSTLIFVKPRLTRGASLDLVQYQATHPDFPQESTADQFFDDEQWESYRKLGMSLGEALLARIKPGPAAWTGLTKV
jgi:hypothetical protein